MQIMLFIKICVTLATLGLALLAGSVIAASVEYDLVRRSLRKDLPDMLACIRGLANASVDKHRIVTDLKRCPGDTSGVLK